MNCVNVRIQRLFLVLALAAAVGCALIPPRQADAAVRWENVPQLKALFADAGVRGTFVLYDREKNIFYGYDHERAQTRYLPASTFKILNSLIAFETGAVKDTQEILPYGGQPQTIATWQRDMNIKEAIAMSNVPLYQGIARRIGLQRMAAHVKAAGYGNADIGTVVDNFWLKGPLAISAVEQTLFLDALLRRALPFSQRSYDLLDEIMPRETATYPQGVIFFKTGTAQSEATRLAWVVGWVRTDRGLYPFALNLDGIRQEDIDQRLPLMRKALELSPL